MIVRVNEFFKLMDKYPGILLPLMCLAPMLGIFAHVIKI